MADGDLQALVAIEQIKHLKHRYLRTLDLKRWDEFADCFVPEATGDYGESLRFESRQAIVDYMRSHLGPGVVTVHHCHHPEIRIVDGDIAEGTWYLEDRVLVPDAEYVLEGAAFYSDRYVRTAAGWRIEHTGYQRTHEVTWSTADLPSYRFTTGTAYAEEARRQRERAGWRRIGDSNP